jgi:hypothetical protein
MHQKCIKNDVYGCWYIDIFRDLLHMKNLYMNIQLFVRRGLSFLTLEDIIRKTQIHQSITKNNEASVLKLRFFVMTFDDRRLFAIKSCYVSYIYTSPAHTVSFVL